MTACLPTTEAHRVYYSAPEGITVRTGLPYANRRFLQEVENTEMAVLLSANSFWNPKKGAFEPKDILWDFDWALDSGGFVAMHKYGGFRWSVDDYVAFAHECQPTWWAAMDYCCEVEVAGSKAEVQRRIMRTISNLVDCRLATLKYNQFFGRVVLKDPVPVIQGWAPDDYAFCLDKMMAHVYDELPPFVGLGSVCRRQLNGPTGLFRILGRLDEILPPQTRLHLFGVKGDALTTLRDHPRVASIDSMAWDATVRINQYRAGLPQSNSLRIEAMRNWHLKQQARAELPLTRQLALF